MLPLEMFQPSGHRTQRCTGCMSSATQWSEQCLRLWHPPSVRSKPLRWPHSCHVLGSFHQCLDLARINISLESKIIRIKYLITSIVRIVRIPFLCSNRCVRCPPLQWLPSIRHVVRQTEVKRWTYPGLHWLRSKQPGIHWCVLFHLHRPRMSSP